MGFIKKNIQKVLIFLNLENKRKYFHFWIMLKLSGIKRIPISSNRKKSRFEGYNANIIFIHIPKAAGMSIVNTLYNRSHSSHATALDYFEENPRKFKAIFSFAITRNPYARLYSAYYYLKSGGMGVIDRVWWDLYLSKYESFEMFITEGGLENAVSRMADHFIPQYKFIYSNDNNRLCNFVGKIENLTEVESLLSNKLKKEITFTRNNVKNTKELDMSTIYNNDMLKVVNRVYSKDFELFGYDKIS